MNFFADGMAIVKRADNGGYSVELIRDGLCGSSAAFSDYEAFSQWLGEQAREFELKRDNQPLSVSGTVTVTQSAYSTGAVVGGPSETTARSNYIDNLGVRDCQFTQASAVLATDEAPPYPDIPLPPDARWCRDPAGGWVLVDDRGHIHATHD